MLTYKIARMSLGIHFLILLCQTTWQYLVWWTKYWAVHFKCHCRNSIPGYIRHEEKSECVHCRMQRTFPTLNITLFFDFYEIYFLTNRTCVRNGLRDFLIMLSVYGEEGLVVHWNVSDFKALCFIWELPVWDSPNFVSCHFSTCFFTRELFLCVCR
jgi:hypothetical protein